MQYMTVAVEAQSEIEIRRSHFICNVKEIGSIEEGTEYVNTISARYPDATHHCYAIRTFSGEQKFSDNGEPKGTAALPIAETLKKRSLTNVVCVVTRYFGGIKLGASGLVSAYTQAVADALNVAGTVVVKKCIIATLECEYSEHGNLNLYLSNNGYPVMDTKFQETVTIKFAFAEEDRAKVGAAVAELTAGKRTLSVSEIKFVKYHL